MKAGSRRQYPKGKMAGERFESKGVFGIGDQCWCSLPLAAAGKVSRHQAGAAAQVFVALSLRMRAG